MESIASLVIKITVTSFILFFTYHLYIFFRHCWILRGHRGSFALPFIGDIGLIPAAASMRIMQYLAAQRKQYGQMFTFMAVSNAYLVVCDPVVVRRILSDAKTFVKGRLYRDYFHIVFGEGLVTSLEDKHKVDRAIFGKYFTRTNIVKYVPRINSVAKEMVDELAVKVAEKKTQNIEHFFAVLSLRTFAEFAFTSQVPRESEKWICHDVSNGSFIVGAIGGLSLPKWRFMPYMRILEESRNRTWRVFRDLIGARKEALLRGELTNVDDVITAMLANNMSDTEMRDHTITMISAGHDTTAYFASYLCYLLSTHQEIQDRVRQEMNDVLGNREDLSPDDMLQLPFLQKVMMETLRMYAVIPMMTRRASEDVYVKERDILIRKNTELLIPLFIINRDPELWDRPGDFNPDRFDADTNFTSAKQGFFPFGYGARVCIGNTLSQMESAIFLCHLLRRFKLKAVPGFRPAIAAGISLTTLNGVMVECEAI